MRSCMDLVFAEDGTPVSVFLLEILNAFHSAAYKFHL